MRGASGGRGGSAARYQGSVASDPARLTRLGEIVIVAGYPEDRDHRPLPLPLQHSGQGGGRERLVDGVERAGEEPRLLASGDDEGAGLAETCQGRFPGGRRQDGVCQRRIEVSLAGCGRLDGWRERSRHYAERHSTCPTRMVRGEPEVSGAAS